MGQAQQMNYYQILGVSPSATQVEIDRAYQKLVKEARFNASMNRKDIETAYRLLSDPTKKALYDAALSEDSRKVTRKLRQEKEAAGFEFSQSKRLVVLTVLTIAALVLFYLHYGYLLQSFSVGDVLVTKNDGKVFGTVMQTESGHMFGSIAADAYLIQMEKGNQVWIPKDSVKLSCAKK